MPQMALSMRLRMAMGGLISAFPSNVKRGPCVQ
jgi:hypothetical protein